MPRGHDRRSRNLTIGQDTHLITKQVGPPSLANMRNAGSGPAEYPKIYGKSSAAPSLQAENYSSRPADMKTASLASLGSLFHPIGARS